MPRKVTGAPTSRLPRDPVKNSTALSLGVKKSPLPKVRMPATTKARAPRTNAPMSFVLDFRAIQVLSPAAEVAHPPLVSLKGSSRNQRVHRPVERIRHLGYKKPLMR